MHVAAKHDKYLIGRAIVCGCVVLSTAVVGYRHVRTEVDAERRSMLDAQWAGLKGYLRVGMNHDSIVWYYDNSDRDAADFVKHIQDVFVLSETNGQVLEISSSARHLGLDSPTQIRESVQQVLDSGDPSKAVWLRRNDRGKTYLVRSGIVYDERHRAPYYVATALPFESRSGGILSFVSLTIAGVTLPGILLGWYFRSLIQTRSNHENRFKDHDTES